MNKPIYPDKPVSSQKSILTFEDDRIALSKLDGWSTAITIRDGKVEFISRNQNPLPVSENLIQAVKQLKLPDQSIIWGEWMKRRPDYEGPECIYLLSPLYINDYFVGGKPFVERWDWLNGLGLPSDDLNLKNDDQMLDVPLILPACTTKNFAEFFEENRKVRRTEGVVIYKKNGTLVINNDGPFRNRDMKKVKWRAGSDGRNCVV